MPWGAEPIAPAASSCRIKITHHVPSICIIGIELPWESPQDPVLTFPAGAQLLLHRRHRHRRRSLGAAHFLIVPESHLSCAAAILHQVSGVCAPMAVIEILEIALMALDKPVPERIEETAVVAQNIAWVDVGFS